VDEAQEWEAAGLYDPHAPTAADRLALLQHLAARGATIDEMRRSQRDGRLAALAGALVRAEGRTMLTPAELARAGIVDLDDYARIWRAAGLPVLSPDERGLTDLDADALANFAVAASVFGETEILQFTRVMGAALAAIAEAATVLFGLAFGGPQTGTNASEMQQAAAFEDASKMLVDVVPEVMRALFLQHIEQAGERYTAGGGDSVGATVAYLAVGFVDVVESTPMVQRLPADEIASAITEFEQRATETVSAHRGRVVKTIGDEVMFVTTTAADAAATAVELVAFADAHPAIRGVRGSLAWGQLVRGYADFYGPVVNLAARAVKEAQPGEVLAELEAVEQLRAVPGFRVGTPREVVLRGFGEPVVLWPIRHVEGA
jgi:class 3 adenylate cyclase